MSAKIGLTGTPRIPILSSVRTGRYLIIALAAAALGVVMVVVAILGYRMGTSADRANSVIEEVLGEGDYTEYGPVTLQTIRLVAELTTVEMVQYTTVVKGNDRGWLNWARGDRIEMFAVARIGAGIDLDAIAPEDLFVDREAGRVVLRLPSADITYVAVDNEATHVYDRDTGVFTKGDPDLERAARLAAEELLVAQALDDGILNTAEERSVEILTDLIMSLGYDDVEVVVTP